MIYRRKRCDIMKRILKFAFVPLMVALCLVLPMKAEAAEVAGGTCGENLTWEFDEETGTLAIKGTGAMYEYADGYVDGKTTPPWADGDRDRIKRVVIEEGVTTISDAAFCGFEKIQSVSIASTVESIGGIAFEYCYSLEQIVLPDCITSIGVSAFLDCRQLSSVVVGSEIETIGGFAFGGCSSLKTITFRGNAPSFGNNPNDVFCDVTATVYYPADNTTWTSAVMQDYGGTITWVAYGEDSTEYPPELAWFFEKVNAPDNFLWATGLYHKIMEAYGG